jgi:glutathione synthase/RimK-type ligase-like ATP-grasp enzyme
MILIISSSYSYEQGTEAVVEWLNYYSANFKRISLEDIYNGKHNIFFDINDKKIICDEIDLCKNINVIYFRKKEMMDITHANIQLNREINGEKSSVIDYIFYMLRDKKWLPKYSHTMENKIISLDFAMQHNIKIPKTLITNKKSDVIRFKNK